MVRKWEQYKTSTRQDKTRQITICKHLVNIPFLARSRFLHRTSYINFVEKIRKTYFLLDQIWWKNWYSDTFFLLWGLDILRIILMCRLVLRKIKYTYTICKSRKIYIVTSILFACIWWTIISTFRTVQNAYIRKSDKKKKLAQSPR